MAKLPFEKIWESAEDLHKEINDGSTSTNLIDELVAKLAVYKAIAQNEAFPSEEKTKLKNYTMTKILLTLTHLSLVDNINVYTCLENGLNELKIDQLGLKYK